MASQVRNVKQRRSRIESYCEFSCGFLLRINSIVAGLSVKQRNEVSRPLPKTVEVTFRSVFRLAPRSDMHSSLMDYSLLPNSKLKHIPWQHSYFLKRLFYFTFYRYAARCNTPSRPFWIAVRVQSSTSRTEKSW